MTSTTLIERSNVPGRKHVFLVGTDASGNAVEVLVSADGSTSISPIAGEENIGTANAMLRTRRRVNATKLTAITAVTIGAGGVGDAVLHGILIELNATAVTATIAGFGNEASVAKNMVLTGAIATDTHFKDLDSLNNIGALTVTASVADKVWVFWSVK